MTTTPEAEERPTRITKAALKEAGHVFDFGFDDCQGAVERTIRDLEETMVNFSLWQAAPAILSLQTRCADGGHASEETALEVGDGTRAFAVAVPHEDFIGVAVVKGDDRFVTYVHRNEAGAVTQVDAKSWKPEASAFLAGLSSDLPSDWRSMKSIDIVRLAEQAAGFAAPYSTESLAQTASSLKKGDVSHPWIGQSAVRDYRPRGRDPIPFARLGDGPGWFRYAAVMRPLVLGGLDQDAFKGADNREMAAMMAMRMGEYAMNAVEVDGGFSGPFCQALAEQVRTFLIASRLKHIAPEIEANAADAGALGYAWGNKLLNWGDYDRYLQAVDVGRPGVSAMLHQNVDTKHTRLLFVVERDGEGALEKVAVYTAHTPAKTVRRYFGPKKEGTPGQLAIALSLHGIENVHCYADPEADPPRLTTEELVQRLLDGAEMPPPAAGYDAKADRLLASAFDLNDVARYAPAAVHLYDRSILDRLKEDAELGGGDREYPSFAERDRELEELDGPVDDPDDEVNDDAPSP